MIQDYIFHEWLLVTLKETAGRTGPVPDSITAGTLGARARMYILRGKLSPGFEDKKGKRIMYAVWYEQLGPAEQVLHFGEIMIPPLEPDDVRVRVHVSGVNPSDVKRRKGVNHLPLPFPRVIPHSDSAGVIEAVGANVSSSRIGERVWLWNAQFGRPFGTAAEYVVISSKQAVPLPDGVDFGAGAYLGVPALTAHRCLHVGKPVRGQTILIAGGAGSVGHAAIQLAKWTGATVITEAAL